MRTSIFFLLVALTSAASAACGGDTGSGGSGGSGGGGGGPTGGGGQGSGGGQVCGGLAGYVCPLTEYCDFPDDDCGAADGTGICKPRPAACDASYAPVCGCDGAVHGNDCGAYAAGTDLNLAGGCPPPVGMFACGEKFCSDGMVCTRYGNDVPGPEAFYGCGDAPPECNGMVPTCACASGLADACAGTCEDVDGGVIISCPGG